MIHAVFLNALLKTYAPQMPKSVAASIVCVESGGDSWALSDNTDGVSYRPMTYREAVSLARRLIGARHSVDVGLLQINFPSHASEISIEDALDPRRNIAMAQRIFTDDMRRTGGELRGALSLYNSGSATASLGYADRVLAAMSSPFVATVAAARPVARPRYRSVTFGTSDVAFRASSW